MRHKLLEQFIPTLNGCGLPWTCERGTKHLKIKICGQLVGILPCGAHTRHGDSNPRATLNIHAQIRRHI